MGRPPMPIGTYGKIKTREIGPKKFEAYARYRDRDGKLKPMQRVGSSKTNAENNLKTALKRINDDIHKATMDQHSRLEKVARSWIQEMREKTAEGEFAEGTLRGYVSWAENWVIPRLGYLVPGNKELSVAVAEGFVKKVRKETSLDGAESARTVLSLICRHAIKHRLIDHNPVRDIDPLKARPEDLKEIRALKLEERIELLAKLKAFCEKKKFDSMGRSLGIRAQVWLDLPDLVEAMFSTGARIGEIVCVHSTNVFPATGPAGRKVELTHHLERVPRKGLARKPGRKGGEPPITKFVPAWSVPMWRRRKLAAGNGLIFASWSGGLLDDSTLIHRLREALDACGFEWVTSHVFRKTYALVLKEAGFTDAQIAQELGNTEQVAKKHYIPPATGTAAAATATEGMFALDTGAVQGPDESAD
jgi:integrase